MTSWLRHQWRHAALARIGLTRAAALAFADDRRGASVHHGASCHRFQANQLRLLLAALAYTLMINLRRLGLKDTELAQACTATIRTRLLKIGAAILRNTRRVRVLPASCHPMKHVFMTAARALAP